MALLTFVFIIPFLWMLGSSFRTQAETFQYVYPLSWRTFVPIHFTSDNFRDIFVNQSFGLFIQNTLVVSLTMVALSWYVNSMAAYAFSRAAFRGKEWVYLVILGAMLIPLDASIVPTYLIARGLHLEDSLWALIIPWVAEPFGIFLLRQHIDEIPRDLDQSAAIDGAGFFQIYRYVILPNIRPGQITLAIMKFLWAWSAFFWPLVIIDSKVHMVLPVAIATLFTEEQTYWGQIFAAASVAVIPMAILFIALQRYYVRGVVLSGIK
jgi:multiple sugar transport system permease protein/putative chitobiose transport system permease protein